MMYFKLSIRNSKRSFTNYLLYIVTMTILLTVMEISNCISIMGKSAHFQTISLPLLITIIQIILVGYIDAFMLKQRAKEFASYLLLGMGKNKLTGMFLCEILLIGFFCFLAGTTLGFAAYGSFYFSVTSPEIKACGFLYGKSLLYTFFYFCIIETICAFRLKHRLDKLQIRELMYENNRNQRERKEGHYKNWGAAFFISFVCFMGFVCGIVFLPENHITPLISTIAIPLLLSVITFYQWIFGFLYAHRRKQSPCIYQKNRLYILANLTSNFKTAAIMNAVFCMCFLFSAASFMTGSLMLQPEFRLFEIDIQQWMGISQIAVCIIFTVIYFSILSLQQMIALRQETKNIQILHYLGKSNKQIKALIKKLTALKLTMPMLMAYIIFAFCLPLLNRKMNFILPVTMRNALFQFAGVFCLCILFFYLCYFLTINKQIQNIAQ